MTLDDAQILRDLAVQHPETAPAIERAIKEIASLRITLGGKTFSADIPEPIGCPMPGACAQVAEISRLRTELDGLYRTQASMQEDCDAQEAEITRLMTALDSIARLAAKLPQDGPGGEVLTLACTGLVQPKL